MRVWFQKELPYPDVDLGNIKPRPADCYPKELEEKLKGEGEGMAAGPINSEFYAKYKALVYKNFFGSYDSKREKNLLEITVSDYAKRRHLLPQFLSKVASPDSNNFTSVDPDDSFLTQFEQHDFHNTKG